MERSAATRTGFDGFGGIGFLDGSRSRAARPRDVPASAGSVETMVHDPGRSPAVFGGGVAARPSVPAPACSRTAPSTG